MTPGDQEHGETEVFLPLIMEKILWFGWFFHLNRWPYLQAM